MGLAQLSTLKKRSVKLKTINKLYKKKLKDLSHIKILDFKKEEVPLWTDAIAFKNRDGLIKFLKKIKLSVESFGFRFTYKNHLKKKALTIKIHLRFIINYFGYHHH